MSEYTFTDGSTFRAPDDWGVGETMNYLYDHYPARMGRMGYLPDMRREFDNKTGVRDFGVRWGLALAGGNMEEAGAELDNQVGEGNWGIHEGRLWVRPDGLEKLGQTPTSDKKVFVDPTRTELFDLVDMGPEAIKIGAMIGAELATGLFPATLVGSSMIARTALSPTLVGMALRGGAATGLADATLEWSQSDEFFGMGRGTQSESLSGVLKHAGIEAATVGALTFGLGLPFVAGKSVLNKARGATDLAKRASPEAMTAARDKAQQAIASLKSSQPETVSMTPAKIIEAEDMLVDLLMSRGVSIDDIPLATIYSLVKDNPGIIGITLANLERAGSFANPTVHLQKTLDSLPTILNKLRAAGATGDDVLAATKKLQSTLTAQEKRTIKEILANERVLAGKGTANDLIFISQGNAAGKAMFAEMNAAEFAQEFAGFVNTQLKSGVAAFSSPKMYGTKNVPNPALQMGDWSGLSITPARAKNVNTNLNANLFGVNREGLAEGVIAEDLTTILARVTGGKAQAQLNRFEHASTSYRTKQPVTKEQQFTVQDAYEIALETKKNMRANPLQNFSNRKDLSDAIKVADAFDNLALKHSGLPAGVKRELNRIRKDYKNFIKPFETVNNLIVKGGNPQSIENVAQLFENMVKGRGSEQFTAWVNAVDKVLDSSRIPGLEVTASGLTPEMFWASFSYQTMQGLRRKFGLTGRKVSDLQDEGIASLEKAAKGLVSYMEKIGKQQGPNVGKAMKKVTEPEFFKRWYAAVKQVASGDRNGVKNISRFLDRKQSKAFIESTNETITGMGGKDGLALMSQLRADLKQIEKLDPDSLATMRNDFIFPTLNSQLYYARSLGTSDKIAAEAGLMKWADNIIRADNLNRNPATGHNDILKYILGKDDYLTYVNFATVLKASFEMFGKQGMLAAASQPTLAIRAAATLNAKGIVAPLTMMGIFKNMTPRTPAWFKARELAKSGKKLSLGEAAQVLRTSRLGKGLGTAADAMRQGVGDVSSRVPADVTGFIRRALRSTNALLAGRNGIMAASVANELNNQAPNTPRPHQLEDAIPPTAVEQVEEPVQQAAPDQISMSDREAQIGKNMLAAQTLLSSVPPPQAAPVPSVDKALAEGKRIAARVA
tara:strand:- start:623 stop:3985 length:3363 start_codon:yes stop_codon:yes gene_type:complete